MRQNRVDLGLEVWMGLMWTQQMCSLGTGCKGEGSCPSPSSGAPVSLGAFASTPSPDSEARRRPGPFLLGLGMPTEPRWPSVCCAEVRPGLSGCVWTQGHAGGVPHRQPPAAPPMGARGRLLLLRVDLCVHSCSEGGGLG